MTEMVFLIYMLEGNMDFGVKYGYRKRDVT